MKNILKKWFSTPERYQAMRDHVIVNSNVPESDIRQMREQLGEPVAPGRMADAASTKWNKQEILYFSPEMEFTTEQTDAIAEAFNRMLIRAALPILADYSRTSQAFPLFDLHLDEEADGTMYQDGNENTIGVIRLPKKLKFTEKQLAGIRHEGSHSVSRALNLLRDPTHDKDGGVFARH